MVKSHGKWQRVFGINQHESAQGIRRLLLETLRTAVDADAAVVSQAVEHEGEFFYARMTVVGDRDIQEQCRGMLDQRIHSPPGSDLRLSDRRERRRFLHLSERWPSDAVFRSSSAFRVFYGPLNIRDDLRLLAYHDRRFLGHVLCFRRKPNGSFSNNDSRLLNGYVQPIVDALNEAERLESEAQPVVPIFVLFGRDGHIIDCSSQSQLQESRSRLDRLRARVRDFADSEDHMATFVVSGLTLELAKLGPEAGGQLVARLRTTDVPRLRVDAVLSPTQRRVAEFAAAGATTHEMAAELEISSETIRSHLRAIYRRLDVSSRVELVHFLSDSA